MRWLFTDKTTEIEAGKIQTWYGHEVTDKLEDFLPKTYAVGTLSQRRFKYVADTFVSGAKKDVLEIGAGCGDLSVYCSTLYPNNSYTVSDVSKDLLDRFFPRVRAWFNSTYEFKLAYFPAEAIPFRDESFDVVLMKSTVHHFDDFKKAFAEIRRVLRPGGKAVFINDPICLNIPLYREIRNLTFAIEHRAYGSNCRIYPFSVYMACGRGFSKAEWQYDPPSLEDIKANTKRTGWKKQLFAIINKSPILFGWFFALRFNTYIFYFTK